MFFFILVILKAFSFSLLFKENKSEINISILSSKLKKSENENIELLDKINSMNDILLLLTFAFNTSSTDNNMTTDNFVNKIKKSPNAETIDFLAGMFFNI